MKLESKAEFDFGSIGNSISGAVNDAANWGSNAFNDFDKWSADAFADIENFGANLT
jgi:hypothetical protein